MCMVILPYDLLETTQRPSALVDNFEVPHRPEQGYSLRLHVSATFSLVVIPLAYVILMKHRNSFSLVGQTSLNRRRPKCYFIESRTATSTQLKSTLRFHKHSRIQ
jgi:hypothetical protein